MTMTGLCDDERLQALVTDLQAGSSDPILRIDEVLADYPEDFRLHFLRGSHLIGAGRLIEAHRALKRAVTLAPDFAIARFQLGFFELTSGEADSALETWARLDRLPEGHYLRKFVDGLRCLIRDEFDAAIANLREGIALNQENPPLNNDMQMIIDQCGALLTRKIDEAGDAVSETSLLLKRFGRERD